MINLDERYVLESLAQLPENKGKILISNESYAICEFISELINELKLSRRK